MAVYKDKKRGTWYVSLYYTDWTGKQQRKLKRGFSTKKEAQDWERHFSVEKASSLDMTFGDFYKRYTDDVKPKLRENTWKSKEYVIELKILPYFKDLVMREITPRDVIAWLFYYNFSFDSYICYEVEGSQVKITTYTGPSGAKSVSYGRLKRA